MRADPVPALSSAVSWWPAPGHRCGCYRALTGPTARVQVAKGRRRRSCRGGCRASDVGSQARNLLHHHPLGHRDPGPRWALASVSPALGRGPVAVRAVQVRSGPIVASVAFSSVVGVAAMCTAGRRTAAPPAAESHSHGNQPGVGRQRGWHSRITPCIERKLSWSAGQRALRSRRLRARRGCPRTSPPPRGGPYSCYVGRGFDVQAAGAFLLSDRRRAIPAQVLSAGWYFRSSGSGCPALRSLGTAIRSVSSAPGVGTAAVPSRVALRRKCPAPASLLLGARSVDDLSLAGRIA